MVADLPPVKVEGAGTVVRPLDVSKLDVVVRFLCVIVNVEADLEQLVQLLPLNRGVEIHPAGEIAQAGNLHHFGVVQTAGDPDRSLNRAGRNQLETAGSDNSTGQNS